MIQPRQSDSVSSVARCPEDLPSRSTPSDYLDLLSYDGTLDCSHQQALNGRRITPRRFKSEVQQCSIDDMAE